MGYQEGITMALSSFLTNKKKTPRLQQQQHRNLRTSTTRSPFVSSPVSRVAILSSVTLLFVAWNLYVQQRTAQWYQQQQQQEQQQQQQQQEIDPHPKYDPLDTSTSLPPKRAPTHHACDGYDGIYHIQVTDELGGVGTAFFQLVIGQILYAERHNLKPWIHFTNFSKVFYDPPVHGQGPGVQFTMHESGNATYIHRPTTSSRKQWRDQTPGPPDYTQQPQHYKDFAFAGTGVWEHYFEPISDFVPGDQSCRDKYYVTMDLYLITPGIHGYDTTGLATRCWRYDYLPDYVTRPHWSYHEWWEPQRIRAHQVLQHYVHVRSYLLQASQRVNPHCSTNSNKWCLGIHVRHSDKAAGRQVLDLSAFVPYVQAFLQAGGDYVYVATDSALVLQEIHQTWPTDWTHRIRSMGQNVIRSTNRTAVFDMASHHRTNQEVLVEILALSQCNFLVHGLSAVSETSIWLNLEQHNRSVNLEDPDHISAADFEKVVALTKAGAPQEAMPQPPRTDKWWNQILMKREKEDVVSSRMTSCEMYNGTLFISETAAGVMDEVFFSSVLNQLLLAQKFRLKPIVSLNKQRVEWMFEDGVHEEHPLVISVLEGSLGNDHCPILPLPGTPLAKKEIIGTNIWHTYFLRQTDEQPCPGKPVYWFTSETLATMLQNCPWAIRTPPSPSDSAVWNPNNLRWTDYLRPIRNTANNIVSDYMQFRPILHKKASEVNPLDEHSGETCLGVLFQMTRNPGRKGVTADTYLPYLKAFAQASNGPIYIASDTLRPMRYMEKNFPAEITRRFRSQGRWVVRSSTADTPLHMMDGHHRINSEMLVNMMALSKCRILLHSSNTMAEAVLYLNPMHVNSINLEDPRAPAPTDLPVLLGTHASNLQTESVVVKTDGSSTTIHVSETKVLFRQTPRSFSRNAIVYLAQKKHSSYGRDSFGSLLRSLELLRDNYLEKHPTDIFIFHVASFDKHDLATIEQVLGPGSQGAVRLVDLDQSPLWGRPDFLQSSDPNTWYAYPLFSEGYRHMIQFFAIHIWEFFARLNQAIAADATTPGINGPGYRYILRLDEDSFLHSPIDYNIFDFMETHGYVYGYRMCSYEMQTAKRMWVRYQQTRPNHVPKRDLEMQGCGFYNNFFVADLQFFRQAAVQDFLQFIHERGHIYVWRLGDLMIHTMTVHKFADATQVHRFLDFTYEHGTTDNTTGCLTWGGMQAGYRDGDAQARLTRYYEQRSKQGACALNQTTLTLDDLSPTYAHLPAGMNAVSLQTVVAGNVEVIGKGLLSG